jgi:hypothetical protein
LEKAAPSFDPPKSISEKPIIEKAIIEKLAVERLPRKLNRYSLLTVVVSSAAMILFLVLIHNMRAPPTRTPVGRVVQLTNASFPKTVRALTEGRDFFDEPLSLLTGSVLLELDTGTRLFLTAPTQIEPLNADFVVLTRGKLLAQVPPRGLGFTISTPQGSVVVYGTEFALSVDSEGNTHVEVLKGKVDLRSNSNPLAEATSYLLGAGQIGKVDASGVISVESKQRASVPSRRTLERVWAGEDEKTPWKEPSNWENQEIPDAYSPAFFQGRPTQSICVIDERHTGVHRARAEYINIGLWGFGSVEMTGGELETEEIWIGRRDGGEGIFTITGGTVRITEKREGIIIGKSWELKAGNGVMNFRGGSILFEDPADKVILGWGYPAAGVLNMEGGRLSLPGEMVLGGLSDEVQSPAPLLGTGYVNVKAGTLHVGSLLIRQGRVDIQGGVFVLSGDVRAEVQEHIRKEQITAYNGTGTLRIHYDAEADQTLVRGEP